MPCVGASGAPSIIVASGVCRSTTGSQATRPTSTNRSRRISLVLTSPCPVLASQIVLDGLFVTPAVTAIAEALTSAHVEGKLAVIGNAKLAAALAAKHEVLPIGL